MCLPSPSSDVKTLEQGFEYLRLDNLGEAMQIANQLLEQNPNLHGALNLAGLIAQRQGNLEQSIHRFQQATAIEPSEAIYYGNLGACYRQSRRYEEAIQACESALKLRPDYINALLTLGSTYFALEQYPKAELIYQQVIHLQPEQAINHAYLADALRELGRMGDAIKSYEKALELDPNLSYATGNLGVTLLSVGQPDRALTYCRQAAECDPSSSQNWMNLGTAYRVLGDVEAAMEAYGQAYDLDSQSGLLCTLIGQVWEEVRDLTQAMLWFEQALDVEPDRIDTQCALGNVILSRGDIETAITHFQTIKDEHPDHYQAYLGLSKALWEDGNAEEAIQVAHQAVALRPEDAKIKAHLATILASAGAVEAANVANREALEANPNCIAALFNLAQNLRAKLPPSDVQQMENLLTAQWVHAGAQASLHFGLASYYDGCKNYAQAATHCIQANALFSTYNNSRGWNYKVEDYRQYVDRAIEHFTPAFFQHVKGIGNPSITPVFVIGMPRSGTTLTEQILASHPKIFGIGERNFANRGFHSLPMVMGYKDKPSVWNVLENIEKPHVDYLSNWHLNHLRKLMNKASVNGQEIQYVVDKMPDNYNLLGWIVTLFPNAKIIHCRRNVYDIAVSCWMNQFESIQWAFDLTYIADRINQYRRIMNHWRQVLPVTMLEIDYEETVADQNYQTARLLDFLELDWDDSCLKFYQNQRLVRTASVTQVRQPIYTRSLERWRHYEEALQPLIELLET